MAKAIKIAGAVVLGAGLILATGGVAAGLGLAATLGASSGVLGLSVGALILAGSSVMTLGTALARPKVPQTQTDRLYAQLNPREFRKTVLGQTALPVDVRHEEWEGANQEWCRWIVAHASHGIDGVEEIWFGTELAWSATTGVTSKYRGYFFVDAIVLEGSPSNALSLSNQWNGTRHLTGCAYSAWRFKTTGNGKKAESPFSGGPPSRITVIGRGAKLYDPRRDSTVPGGSGPMRADDQSTWRFVTDDGVTIGENLPLQILRVALGGRIRNPATGEMRLATGSGVPKRRINLQSFIPAANLADERVNRSAGGTEPRYHGACVLSEGDEPRTWFDMLCTACNARFRDTGGKLSIDIAHNDHAAAATDDGLTTDDVVGGHRWEPDASLEAIPNVVRGKYVDASAPALYQLIDYPEIRIPSLDGVDRILSLDLGAVESASHAQRVASQALQRKQYPRTFTAPFDIRAWKYPVGALVPFTYAPLSFKRMLFRVRAQELGQNGQCVMTLAYEHPSFYAWDADDRAPVMAADPVVYDATNNPLILAIGDAAKTADWSAVTGSGKPADYATNSADPTSPFGNGTVKEAVAQLARIEPIGRDTAVLKEAQKDLDDAVDRLRQSDDAAVVALAELRGVVLDGAASQRQLQRAEGKLAAATLQLLMMSDAADTRMRDAGFITDPATGKVYAYALDRLGDRQTKVEATLDAQAGQIALRATSTEVDEKILKAVLNPEQVAQLEPLLARIAAVEVVYDALKAEVRTKAELVELTKAVARITNAEQRISAAEGLIASKVEQTSFDQALIRIGSAEQLLQSYGDVSRYSVELRQARAARSQSDQALLASILGEHQADELRLTAQALLRQELYAKIVDGDALEARARTEIGLQLRALNARSVQDRFLSIDRDAVLAQDIDALGVQNSQQSAEIASLQKTSLAAGVGIAGVEQTIRQQARGQSQADAALLGGILGSDQAESRFITSLAEIHSQLTTTLVAGFQAEAVARQGLRARIDSADARFDQEARSTADRIRAVTTLITSLGARFDDQATGLAATQSDLSRLERVTAEAAQANVDAITQLRAIVTDPKTGLEKTRTALTSLTELVATQNTAAIRRLDLLEGQVNDPATGLAWARGAIADLARVTTSRDDAAAESIRQVRAEVDGVGGVGLEQAMKAVVDRLGKIEGTITFKIDVDGNLTGLQLVGGAKGPGSLNLINTDLRMGKGMIIKNTGAFMSVEGVGFGVAKDLIEWFGPTMAVDQCSRANAITYKATNGDVYTGGSFSAGTLRNGNASSSLAADAVAEVPAFGSNGKPVRYVASWSYYSEYTRTFAADNDGLDQFNRTVASFNAKSDDGGAIYFGSKNDQRDSSTITLSRAFAGASYAQLDQRSFTTEQVTFRGLKPTPGDAPGRATFTASIGGGFTVLDPVQSTANRTLRLALSRGFTLSEGVIQRLTIVAIEE